MAAERSDKNTEFVHDLLFAAADLHPQKTALLTEARNWSYADLAAAVVLTAKQLKANGVLPGQRVLIILPNSADTIIAVMACSQIGAIFIVLSEEVRPFHLEHIFADASPVLLITSASFYGLNQLCIEKSGVAWALADTVVDNSPEGALLRSEWVREGEERDDTSIACLIYTSGSTGMPKAIVSCHNQICFAVRAISKRLAYRPDDIVGCFLPFSFDYGFYQVYLSFYCGCTLAAGSQQDIGPHLFNRLSAWGVTCLPVSPVILKAMIVLLERRRYKELPPLRMITNTGGYLPHPQIDAFLSVFPACGVYLMYGLTECKRVSIMLPEEFATKRFSVGRPLDGTACYVLDADGHTLPPGEIGELVVTGPHVMKGYWNAEELTRKRFRYRDGQYTLFTGDQCAMDEDGFIFFHGRLDDLFKHNGFRVSSLEIEKAANDIPGVTGSALIIPAVYGDPLVLFVTGNHLTESLLTEALLQRLEPVKIPDKIHIVDKFPLTANGKTDKEKLKTFTSTQIL